MRSQAGESPGEPEIVSLLLVQAVDHDTGVQRVAQLANPLHAADPHRDALDQRIRQVHHDLFRPSELERLDDVQNLHHTPPSRLRVPITSLCYKTPEFADPPVRCSLTLVLGHAILPATTKRPTRTERRRVTCSPENRGSRHEACQ